MVLARGFPAVSGSKKLRADESRAIVPNKMIGRFTLISVKSATVVAKTPPILANREQEPKLAFLEQNFYCCQLDSKPHIESQLPNTCRK